MAKWFKNEPVAALRRLMIYVRDIDNIPANPTITFSGTDECTFDPGTGLFAAALGVLANVMRMLTIAAFNFTAANATEIFTKTAHTLKTGDGPFQPTTTGTLPTGLTLATDYWIIAIDANTFYLATSFANAMAGTHLAITDDGTGTHTLTAQASCKRTVDGAWMYESTTAELNYVGTYAAVRLSKPGVVNEAIVTVDLGLRAFDEIGEGSMTYGDMHRAILSLNGCKVTDFRTGTLVFKSYDGAKTRWTMTTNSTGRVGAVAGDLTP